MASPRSRSARARAGANSSGFSLKDLATSDADSSARSPSQSPSERGGIGRTESAGHSGFGLDAANAARAASPGAAGYELGKQVASRLFGESEGSNSSAPGVDENHSTAALSASGKARVGAASSDGAGGAAENIRGAGALGASAAAGYRMNASESQGHSASEGTSTARSVRSEGTEQVDGERRVGTERSMTEHDGFRTHTYREYETQNGQTREVVHSMLERDGQPIAYSESRSERTEDTRGAAVMRETNTVLAEGRDASELQGSGWAQGGTATAERYERQSDHSLQLVSAETVEREAAPVGRMSPLLDRQTQASLADIVEFITEDNGRSAGGAQNVAGSSPGGHGFDTSGTVSMDTLGGHGSMSAGTNSMNRSDTVDTTKSRGTFDASGSVDIEQSGSFDTRSGGVDTSKGNNLEMSGGPDFGAAGSQGSANRAPESGALAELVSEHLAARNIPAAPESLAELVRNLEAATHQADSGSVLLFHAQGEDVATLHESVQAARSHNSFSAPVSMKTLTEAANDLPALTAGVQEVQQHLGSATGHLTRLEMAEAFSAPLLREIGQEGFPGQQLERIGQALQEQGVDFSDASPEFQGAVSLQALAQMREGHSAQAVGDYLERGTTGSAEADVRMENTLEEQAGRLRENERSQEREVQAEAEMEME